MTWEGEKAWHVFTFLTNYPFESYLVVNISHMLSPDLCQLAHDLQLKWLDIWTNLESKGMKLVI